MSILAVGDDVRGNRTPPKTEITCDIGRRLRHLRVQNGRSQEWLADKMGITFQQIQKYESGTNNISIPRLRVICDIFGVCWSYFLDPLPAMAAAEPQFGTVNLHRNRSTTELIEAFEQIESGEHRRRIISFVQLIAGKD